METRGIVIAPNIVWSRAMFCAGSFEGWTDPRPEENPKERTGKYFRLTVAVAREPVMVHTRVFLGKFTLVRGTRVDRPRCAKRPFYNFPTSSTSGNYSILISTPFVSYLVSGNTNANPLSVKTNRPTPLPAPFTPLTFPIRECNCRTVACTYPRSG